MVEADVEKNKKKKKVKKTKSLSTTVRKEIRPSKNRSPDFAGIIIIKTSMVHHSLLLLDPKDELDDNILSELVPRMGGQVVLQIYLSARKP